VTRLAVSLTTDSANIKRTTKQQNIKT
jgi:hypothetical protein